MNRNELNYAFTCIDDGLINNYFKIGTEYRPKRNKRIRWCVAIAACLAVVVMVPLLMNIIAVPNTNVGNSENNGIIDTHLPQNAEMVSVELFSDGQNLYFTNAFNGQQLIKYNGKDTVLEHVIGKPSDNRVFSGNMLFYTTDEGAFAKDCQSGKITKLLTFGNKMPYPITAIDGYDPERGAIAVDKTAIEEDCSAFILVERKVFFIHNAHKSIGIDGRYLAEEYWSTIYSIDLDTMERETIKSQHGVDALIRLVYVTEDTNLGIVFPNALDTESLYEYGGSVFYFSNFGQIRKYDTATNEDACVYASENAFYDVYWGDGKAYFAESTDQENIKTHVTLDLNDADNIIKREIKQEYTLSLLEYDPKNDLFYSLHKGSIISFKWNDAESFNVLHELSDDINGSIYDIKVVSDKLYFSYSNGSDKYFIVEVCDGKERIIVENGKAC